MYCSNCGKELKETYKFCPKCGEKVIVEIEIKNENDELYQKVLEYVVKTRKASISAIQNEFRVSYGKASKLIKKLEENKVVGPSNGNKGREVLINNVTGHEQKDIKFEDNIKKNIENILDTPDTTNDYDEKDIKDNLILSILSYLGLLAFIPYFVHNDSKFVKYHATQGMNLLIVWVIYTFLENIIGLIKVSKVVVNFGDITGTKLVTPIWLTLPMDIIGGLLIALSFIGIINVCNGKAKELPVIGKLKIVK